MTQNKTKKALLMSVLSMMLCVAMLVGMTFAWFTDTASTSVNKIQAGNLKIEVAYRTSADGEWLPLNEATDLFGNETALYEPGYTRVVELKIKNAGDLALKYKIGMNLISENLGTNMAGDSYKLSDYLKVATTAVQQYDDENQIVQIFEPLIFERGYEGMWNQRDFASFELEKHANGNVFNLMPGAEQILGMKIYMPETVNNDANAITPDQAASINFGLNVLATQYTYESDSINNQYDKDATYLAPGTKVSDTESLKQAITDGQSEISITENIALDDTMKISKDTTIHGNGKIIEIPANNGDAFKVSGTQEMKLVLDNVVIDGGGENLGKAFPINNGGKGTIEINNCTIKNFSGTRAIHSEQADTVKIFNTVFEDITLTGVQNDNSNRSRACLLWLQGTDALLENVTIKNCKVLTGENGDAGSGILIYARNSGTNVTARNLIVENNVVSKHVFATYSTTKDNTYIFESGKIANNTIEGESSRTGTEIFVVGNVIVGEEMTIEQNITINNDSNNGVCTLTNNGTIIGDISEADWAVANRGLPIYTGTGTHTGTKTNINVK